MERGTEIAGFRVENVLGRGHATVVYEATQVDLDRRVALKLLPSDPTLGERLRHLRWPEHPNVVSLYAAGVSEHGGFLAMQLVHGRRLAELGGTRFRQPAARAHAAHGVHDWSATRRCARNLRCRRAWRIAQLTAESAFPPATPGPSRG